MNDDGLEAFIAENATSASCSFCDRTDDEAIAVSVQDLGQFMEACLRQDYGEAVEELPYETAEGGYQGTTYDTYDLLTEELELDINEELLSALCTEIGDQLWCDKDPFGMSHAQELDYSWDRFCRHVKHESRFFIFAEHRDNAASSHQDRDELLAPGALLEYVGEVAGSAGAVKVLPASQPIFRARRVEDKVNIATPLDLGPPKPEHASQNRMSAAGIPMFYGCDEIDTTLAELRSTSGLYAIGEFRARRDLLVLDLTALPGAPEFFELGNREQRTDTLFLRRFAREISKPVDEVALVHIEYVPTQAVTEYFRTVFRYDGRHLDGIAYESSVRRGHRSLVLFATQRDIVLSDGDIATLASEPGMFLVGLGRERAWIELNTVHWRTI